MTSSVTRALPGPAIVTLGNGARLLHYPVPGHTLALSVFVENGARHEAPAEAGYAHLLEHLLFKGAHGLDAEGLSRAFERMGGQVNAYTGREHMVLHGWVPAADGPRLGQLFSHMLLERPFTDAMVAIEQAVVLSEMDMVREDPEDAMAERAIALAWPDHPLGCPILGARETVRAASPASLEAYASRQMTGSRIVAVAAGQLDQPLERLFEPLASLPAGDLRTGPPPRLTRYTVREQAEVSQAHLTWVMPAPPLGAALEPAALVANHLLGGGTSSRLFLEVRERLGLSYDIQSRIESYRDGGLWFIETTCAPEYEAACVTAVEEVLVALVGKGVSPGELDTAMRHLAALQTLEDDDPRSLVERCARDLRVYGRLLDREERVRVFDNVDCAGVNDLLAQAWALRSTIRWVPPSH